MTEQWKPIKGYEGLYEVSSYGRVKSLDKIRRSVNMGGTYTCIRKGIVRRLTADKDGYLKLGLHKERKVETFFVHRLVATAFIGKCPNDCVQVNHKDGNKKNNVPSNLEWCSREGNMRHAYRNGFQALNLHRCALTGRMLKKGTHLAHDERYDNPFIGTSWNKHSKRWRSYITVDGKQTHLGLYKNRDDALAARKAAEKRLLYPNAPPRK